MTKNKNLQTASIEKTVTSASIALILLAAVSCVFYTVLNWRFVDEFYPDLLYYLNYLIVLVGGFVAGYLLTPKSKKGNRLFTASGYAFIATSLYFLGDLMRLPLYLVAPIEQWNINLFEAMPAIAVVATLLLAYWQQKRRKRTDLTLISKWTFILAFLITQIYMVGSGMYYMATVPASNDTSSLPLWLTVAQYLVNPLVILVVTYYLLAKVTVGSMRLFYATFIAAFAYLFMSVAWNFSINPEINAMNVFEGIIILLTLIVTGAIIWRIRTTKK